VWENIERTSRDVGASVLVIGLPKPERVPCVFATGEAEAVVGDLQQRTGVEVVVVIKVCSE